MANKPLKSIKFPGLTDPYTVPEIDSTLTEAGKAADAKKVGDAITNINRQIGNEITGLDSKAPAIVEIASGAIASFDDGADGMSVKGLSVAIEPIQDLHGYEYPWPAGGGKNLLPLVDGTYAIGSTGATAVVVNGSITITGDTTISGGRTTRLSYYFILKAGTYILSPVVSSPYIRGYLNKLSDNSAISYADGRPFTLTEDTEVYYGVGLENGKTYNATIYPQVESGSTITSWTPYSNICPITGWTGAKVTRIGKNLLNPNNLVVASVPYDSMTFDKATKFAQGAYTFNIDNIEDATSWRIGMRVFDANGNVVNRAISNGYVDANVGDNYSNGTTCMQTADATIRNLKITVNKDVYIVFCVAFGNVSSATPVTVQLESGSTATDYEPYQGETYDITFPSEAGTVYGGTLDVTTGELVVDRVSMTFDGSERWFKYGTDDGTWKRQSWRTDALPYKIKSRSTIWSECLSNGAILAKSTSEKDSRDSDIISCRPTSYSSSTMYIFTPLAMDMTVQQLSAMLAENPLQFCYPLATPITYQLTPTEVRTLLGANNIWADTGDTEVTYPADTKIYIDNKITQAIAAALNA